MEAFVYQLAFESTGVTNPTPPWMERAKWSDLFHRIWAADRGTTITRWEDEAKNVFFAITTLAQIDLIRGITLDVVGKQGPVWDLTDITFE